MPRSAKKANKAKNRKSSISANEVSEDKITLEIIDESKKVPLQMSIASLLLKTKDMEIDERRTFVLSTVIQPRFMEFYFKPQYYKSKQDQKQKNASKVTTNDVADFVDKFVVEHFCKGQDGTIEEADAANKRSSKLSDEVNVDPVVKHPNGVEFNFAAEMKRMREIEAEQREQEEAEWIAFEEERRANSNCIVRVVRGIKEAVESRLTAETFCLITVNIIMAGLLAYAIQLLLIRFKFFADDLDHLAHDFIDAESEDMDIRVPPNNVGHDNVIQL